MKYNFLNKYFFLILVSFSTLAYSNAPEKPPKKWPCDQVYNPKLNLTAIWQGPSIEKELKNWWKDDDLIEYVNKLSDPVLEESRGVQLIEEFAKKYTYFGLIKKSQQKQKLTQLFAGLYQKAKDRRNRQYLGIIKFVERQESFRKAIGSSSKLIRTYRKQKLSQKDPKYVEATSQLEWNTRVFDQRTRLTEYICEEPVFNTQRLGYQARKILTFID
jgi:hypothetical protein|tara:strand:+ start:1437 stop:2084 length:648 start_codon:yes stop_codon:yes gene_type:complete